MHQTWTGEERHIIHDQEPYSESYFFFGDIDIFLGQIVTAFLCKQMRKFPVQGGKSSNNLLFFKNLRH